VRFVRTGARPSDHSDRTWDGMRTMAPWREDQGRSQGCGMAQFAHERAASESACWPL